MACKNILEKSFKIFCIKNHHLIHILSFLIICLSYFNVVSFWYTARKVKKSEVIFTTVFNKFDRLVLSSTEITLGVKKQEAKQTAFEGKLHTTFYIHL